MGNVPFLLHGYTPEVQSWNFSAPFYHLSQVGMLTCVVDICYDIQTIRISNNKIIILSE